MPLFALIGRDGARGTELRLLHREAHLAALRPLADAGRVRFAGPLRRSDGTPCGSVVVFEADDFERARELVERDPYVVHGVFEHWELNETLQVFPE